MWTFWRYSHIYVHDNHFHACRENVPWLTEWCLSGIASNTRSTQGWSCPSRAMSWSRNWGYVNPDVYIIIYFSFWVKIEILPISILVMPLKIDLWHVGCRFFIFCCYCASYCRLNRQHVITYIPYPFSPSVHHAFHHTVWDTQPHPKCKI